MEITNKLNLPKALVKALSRDEHVAGGDYSVTQLTKSPRAFWLAKRHKDEIVKDVKDLVWSMHGTAVHSVAEKGVTEDGLAETYFKVKFHGVTITGTADLYENLKLWDYKNVSTNTLTFLDKQAIAERASQLNIYSLLFFLELGFECTNGASDILLFKDWTASKLKKESKYPLCPITELQFTLYSHEQQKEYLISRIDRLESCRNTPDDELPLCSDAYRWVRPSKWAVMKGKNIKASRVTDTLEQAKEWVEWKGLDIEKDKITFVERKEDPWKRCAYCDARKFCNQTGYVEEKDDREIKPIDCSMSFNTFMKEAREW